MTMNSEAKHKKFMQEAINLAINNIKNHNGGPFGAIIVKNGEIVGTGTNNVTTSNDPTAHAEVMAIRDACKNLKTFQLNDCEIYTSCEPCPMCLGAIYWARPKKIYFACNRQDAANAGFDDSYIYDQMPLAPEKRNLETLQMMRSESIKVFDLWKETEDKTPY